MAVSWSSLGAWSARPMVVLMACSAWMILSARVAAGVGRLCGLNLTASLMMTVFDVAVRTR